MSRIYLDSYPTGDGEELGVVLDSVPTLDAVEVGTEPSRLVPLFLDCELGRYFYVEGSESVLPEALPSAALAVLRKLDEYRLAPAWQELAEALRHALALNGRPT